MYMEMVVLEEDFVTTTYTCYFPKLPMRFEKSPKVMVHHINPQFHM